MIKNIFFVLFLTILFFTKTYASDLSIKQTDMVVDITFKIENIIEKQAKGMIFRKALIERLEGYKNKKKDEFIKRIVENIITIQKKHIELELYKINNPDQYNYIYFDNYGSIVLGNEFSNLVDDYYKFENEFNKKYVKINDFCMNFGYKEYRECIIKNNNEILNELYGMKIFKGKANKEKIIENLRKNILTMNEALKKEIEFEKFLTGNVEHIDCGNETDGWLKLKRIFEDIDEKHNFVASDKCLSKHFDIKNSNYSLGTGPIVFQYNYIYDVFKKGSHWFLYIKYSPGGGSGEEVFILYVFSNGKREPMMFTMGMPELIDLQPKAMENSSFGSRCGHLGHRYDINNMTCVGMVENNLTLKTLFHYDIIKNNDLKGNYFKLTIGEITELLNTILTPK